MRGREPLAYKMAPQTLAEYVGQKHILGEGKMLRRMIQADQISSMILFGPPGVGKTSLARVIAKQTNTPFRQLNAVTAGVQDIKRIVEEASNPLFTSAGKIILFIDEIHRFNKLQQDALLPSVEEGHIVLIGATTENPFFAVNKALVSRSTVFQLQALTTEEILCVLQQALKDKERGLGELEVICRPEALQFWANYANGDARIALNALELAVYSTLAEKGGVLSGTPLKIDLQIAEDCLQKRSTAFDADGEGHYDTISALIKSMRGSDPDAALYYLALALHGGEDIAFLGRRIVICAAEDIGLANPAALQVAMAAYQAAVTVGMPEARIVLAEAVVMLATSPKSNAAYVGINEALSYVEKNRAGTIPLHLRNAPVQGMEELGYHIGYQYPHDFPHHYVNQAYLPPEIQGQTFYRPSDEGYEGRSIQAYMAKLAQLRQKKA